ncbi:MAG: tetratricopeptide repeat protein [Elusimicrobiales bacterium]|nr:tetratricopeptide repeat protein [Elusimicrobiales bacterium]
MHKKFTLVLSLILLAGCFGSRKPKSGGSAAKNPREKAAPEFALPGVPMKSDSEALLPEEKKPELAAEPVEAVKPEEAKPAEAKPAETAAAAGGDLEFHLAAASKYFAKRRYRSAAAEYGAAVPFLPAGDARAVRLLERQGAMMLKAGNEAKAQEHFLSAVNKAKELKSSGKDLADAYLGLGYCQEKANKVAEAVDSYEKARALSDSKKVKDRITKTISDLKAKAKPAGK